MAELRVELNITLHDKDAYGNRRPFLTDVDITNWLRDRLRDHFSEPITVDSIKLVGPRRPSDK